MPYSTDADLFDRLDERTVRRLTDDDGTGNVNTLVVEAARATAEEIIHAWIRSAYTDLPITPAPPLLVAAEVDIIAWRLYRRRASEEVPTSIRQSYEDAVATLKRIGKGEMRLGVDADGDGEEDSAAPTIGLRVRGREITDLEAYGDLGDP